MSRRLAAAFVMAVATEHQETAAVIQRANASLQAFPELALLFHVPNEAKRSAAVAARLKAEGMKSGVPDLILPVPRGVYHGLAIEMKRRKGGKLSDNQAEWLVNLQAQGWLAVVCKGQDEAWKAIEQYMKLGSPVACLGGLAEKLGAYLQAQAECDAAFAAEDSARFAHAEKRLAASLHDLTALNQSIQTRLAA